MATEHLWSANSLSTIVKSFKHIQKSCDVASKKASTKKVRNCALLVIIHTWILMPIIKNRSKLNGCSGFLKTLFDFKYPHDFMLHISSMKRLKYFVSKSPKYGWLLHDIFQIIQSNNSFVVVSSFWPMHFPICCLKVKSPPLRVGRTLYHTQQQ